MEGLKLVDASEVKTGRKSSKAEIKKIPKSPMKIISEDSKKITVGDISGNDVIARSDIARSDIVKSDMIKSDIDKRPDIVEKPDMVEVSDITSETNVGRTIRAIKLKEDKYYGPKNVNKNKFVRMYKKLGLSWEEEVSLNDVTADGWFKEDRSQYIIKLLEDGDFKRFKFYGCDEIYDYFVTLGGVPFDYNKENPPSSNYLNNKVSNVESIKESQIGVTNKNGVVSTVGGTVCVEDNDEVCRFVGADLWSGVRSRQLLKKMPDNWGVKWN